MKRRPTPLAESQLTRREFLTTASRGGLLLVVSAKLDGVSAWVRTTRDSAAATLAPNQWISIDQSGVVTITTHKSEMGPAVKRE